MTTIPSAPPSYGEQIDVVQEFATRYEKRKEAIHSCFEKKRLSVDKQYQAQLTQLEKEKSNALVLLHASYIDWINVEPLTVQHHNNNKSYWEWLRSFWGS